MNQNELEEQMDRGYVDESVLSPEPAVIHLNSSVASKAVSELSKLVTGFDAPAGFLRLEDMDNELVELSTTQSQNCVTCGDSGVLGAGVDIDIQCDSVSAEREQQLPVGGER